jgi:hypothetical protein
MKIRISNKGLRFRLSVQDVERLRSVGTCVVTLHPTEAISMGYSIRSAAVLVVEMHQPTPGFLEVCWPAQEIIDWTMDSQKEGIYAEMNGLDGALYTIAIEKDFACSPADEKQYPELFFPRPNSSEKC